MESQTCSVCGGEGRIPGAWNRTTSCPACHGSGRRSEMEPLMRDVTKTKASHHRSANDKKGEPKATWPTTHEGGVLATEVRDSSCPAETKERLIREILEYEGSHGSCTKTFTRKIRKQIRPK